LNFFIKKKEKKTQEITNSKLKYAIKISFHHLQRRKFQLEKILNEKKSLENISFLFDEFDKITIRANI